MKAQLTRLWGARSPRDRVIIAILLAVVGLTLYVLLMQTAWNARVQLRGSVSALRTQAFTLEQQAAELERLRKTPPVATSQTDLRTVIQAEADAAALSRALVRIDAVDANQVIVVFGAVAFAEWLNWITGLKSQQVRLDACRIEALSTPGLVSVTATLARPQPK